MPTITPEEILASLDLDKVSEAILTDPDNHTEILGFEHIECKELVVAAVKKWLVPDLTYVDPSSILIEAAFKHEFAGLNTRGIIDLGGKLKSNHWRGEYRGKTFIADWKTTKGALDKTWETKLRDSYQWRLYAEAYKVDLISYRGISRTGTTRELLIEVPTFNTDNTTRHFTQIGRSIRSFMDAGDKVWTRHMPGACGQYGETCQFLTQCEANNSPEYTLDSADLVLSYSGSERFLSCPEKYRRMAKAERGSDGSENTRTGGAVHRGLAEVYLQSFAKYGGKL